MNKFSFISVLLSSLVMSQISYGAGYSRVNLQCNSKSGSLFLLVDMQSDTGPRFITEVINADTEEEDTIPRGFKATYTFMGKNTVLTISQRKREPDTNKNQLKPKDQALKLFIPTAALTHVSNSAPAKVQVQISRGTVEELYNNRAQWEEGSCEVQGFEVVDNT